MRCEPNDLVVLIRNSTGMQCYDGLIGLMLTVEAVAGVDPYLGVFWRKKGRPAKCWCGGDVDNFLDTDLQPIRPPKAMESRPERLGVHLDAGVLT